MDAFLQGIEGITPAWKDILQYLPEADRARVQEIRMRTQSPLLLSLPEGVRYLRTDSRLSRDPQDPLVLCDRRGVEDTFLRLCGYAVHAHEEELRQGFIRAANGCRCGVAGVTVTQEGQVRSFRRITSLCLRIARPHEGCADELMRSLFSDGRPHSLLIVGEPACGKTSLLRDLARQLADPVNGAGLRVAVVDERGELSGLDTLHGCDVLSGCGKADGILQAIRCLAPDVVLLDELGSPEEIGAIRQSMQCGVAVIASVHADSAAALCRRRAVHTLLEDGTFSAIAVLQGRSHPCKVKKLYSCEEWWYACGGNGAFPHRRRAVRFLGGGTAEKAGHGACGDTAVDPLYGDRVPLSCRAADRDACRVQGTAGAAGADVFEGGGRERCAAAAVE